MEYDFMTTLTADHVIEVGVSYEITLDCDDNDQAELCSVRVGEDGIEMLPFLSASVIDELAEEALSDWFNNHQRAHNARAYADLWEAA